MAYMTIAPAYDRDYKSKKAVLDDWNSGKDFRVVSSPTGHSGGYISKREADAVFGSQNLTIHARYKRLTMVTRVHGKG